MYEIPRKVFTNVIKWLLTNEVKAVSYRYSYNSHTLFKFVTRINHWHIELPETKKALYDRLSSKQRYNRKREYKKLVVDFGEISFQCYHGDAIPDSIVEAYFKFKNETMGTDYGMSPREYLTTFHQDTFYTLSLKDGTLLSIVSTCEQCNTAYLDNLTYNPEYKKYSPGTVLYIHVLEELIRKQKKKLFLGDGHQIYKSYFGGIETNLYEGWASRKNFFSRALSFMGIIHTRIKMRN